MTAPLRSLPPCLMSTDGEPPLKKPKRSRTGCLTCRADKKKCNEERPLCGRCGKMAYECVWPTSEDERPKNRWRPQPRRTGPSSGPSVISRPSVGAKVAADPLPSFPDETAWISALPVLPSPTFPDAVSESNGSSVAYVDPLHPPTDVPVFDTVLSEGELLDLLKGLPK